MYRLFYIRSLSICWFGVFFKDTWAVWNQSPVGVEGRARHIWCWWWWLISPLTSIKWVIRDLYFYINEVRTRFPLPSEKIIINPTNIVYNHGTWSEGNEFGTVIIPVCCLKRYHRVGGHKQSLSISQSWQDRVQNSGKQRQTEFPCQSTGEERDVHGANDQVLEWIWLSIHVRELQNPGKT